ncbi:MAG: fumarate hydratase C-terminal domain-containing protein [Oscillospiraceae bacterium]|nr:fumarate hydratase C-terminal domain-containing protein [Oscillospiraceae bacterium]
MTELAVQQLRERAKDLKAGDRILLSGVIYTARDAAHKKMTELIKAGGELPFELKDSVIYYSGPTPEREGMPVGSCGPTTSSRMDGFSPLLYDLGVLATIGKGDRAPAVREAIVRNGALYLCAVGGAGALLAGCVEAAEIIAFPELGCEAVRRMRIKAMPLYVGIDTRGVSIFE